jgi:hypothetical protein
MEAAIKQRYANDPSLAKPTEEQMTARKRMALFPAKHAEVLFVQENLWVPVVRLKGKLIILPGIPKVRLCLSVDQADLDRSSSRCWMACPTTCRCALQVASEHLG